MNFALPASLFLRQALVVGTAVLAVNSVAAANFLEIGARADHDFSLHEPSSGHLTGSQDATPVGHAAFLGQVTWSSAERSFANDRNVLFKQQSYLFADNRDDNGYGRPQATQSEARCGSGEEPSASPIDSAQWEHGDVLNATDVAMLRQVIPSGHYGESSPATALAIVVLLVGGVAYARLQGKQGKPQQPKRRPLLPA